MAHLVEKDRIVAEIEKIISDETESIKSFEHGKNVSEVQRSNARIGILIHIRHLLDTLEVKEVDLEKEIDLVEDKYRGFESLSRADVIDVAKHFFELGLKAQKGE